MHMTAILVDDEMDGLRTLQRMLEKHCPQVEVTGTATNATTAKRQIELLKPDLVFLDIQMPGKSGLDLLSDLGAKDFEVIFVTAFNEYVLQALQFSAVDYLLKPVDEDRLVEAVGRAEKRLEEDRKGNQADTLLHNLDKVGRPDEMRLCLPTMKGFLIVKLSDIVYCEAERSYTVFHLEDGKTMLVSKALADYETVLRDTTFLRVHKSFLINLLHVREYQRGEGGSVIMSNKAEIEISRRKKEGFLNEIKRIFKT
jgi:two-component system LytT family response regulator